MNNIFTIEENPDTKKKIRVSWDEIHDEIDSHGHSWYTYEIEGVGEDGSVWFGNIEGNETADDFNDEITEVEKESNDSNEHLYLNNTIFAYSGIWNIRGTIKHDEKVNQLEKIPVKEWFNEMLGAFPNIDYKKGPRHKKQHDHLTDNKRIKHQIMTGNLFPIHVNAILKNEDEDFEIINMNDERVIVASESGIIKNNLRSFKGKKTDAIIKYLI